MLGMVHQAVSAQHWSVLLWSIPMTIGAQQMRLTAIDYMKLLQSVAVNPAYNQLKIKDPDTLV